jgi:hypothetical protein
VDVKSATELDGAFDAAKSWRAHALIVLSNPLSLAYGTRIGDLAKKAGLPTIMSTLLQPDYSSWASLSFRAGSRKTKHSFKQRD